jgi:hypothetical protein
MARLSRVDRADKCQAAAWSEKMQTEAWVLVRNGAAAAAFEQRSGSALNQAQRLKLSFNLFKEKQSGFPFQLLK